MKHHQDPSNTHSIFIQWSGLGIADEKKLDERNANALRDKSKEWILRPFGRHHLLNCL